MDAEDIVDCLMWGIIFFFLLACIGVALCFLALTIATVVGLIGRRNDDANSKYDMLIERLLLRPKDDQDNEQCVICLSESEDDVDDGGGERGEMEDDAGVRARVSQGLRRQVAAQPHNMPALPF
uniref:Uncharacterized protein n=1 Tax=Oryza glaberrima TaxID=4538 RepID=I1R3F1_ORYGL